MIDAEYEEIEVVGDELDLTDADSLPWLESDDEDDRAGGIDPSQVIIFVAILFAILLAVVGLVWFLSRDSGGAAIEPDGSTIAAPEGPIKERPDDAGGREFAGTDDVAPVVGEGETRDMVMGEDPVVEEPVATPEPAEPEPAPSPAPTASSAPTGVGVQVAAYGSRQRAEQGWRDLQRKTTALDGVRYRIEQARVDIGTVYRLQAVMPNVSAANELCAALKRDGLDCQVKP